MGRALEGRDGLAAVPDADHRARLLAGRPLRRARAAGRVRAGRRLARPRRCDHADLRPRHRAPVLDVRPRADRGRARARSASACCAGATTSSPATSSSSPAFAAGRSSSATGRAWRGCAGRSAQGRGGIDYDFVGAICDLRPTARACPCSATSRRSPRCSRSNDVDELIVTDSDFNDRELVEIVEQAHRRGVKVRVAPRATELLIERRGEYVPGQGVPLFELRPPVFVGADWVVKRGFDLAVSSARRRRRAAVLAADRCRDQARLARPGALSRPACRAERAGVRDAQVPHDARRRRGAAGRSSRRRTRPRARCSRSATTRA